MIVFVAEVYWPDEQKVAKEVHYTPEKAQDFIEKVLGDYPTNNETEIGVYERYVA